MKFTPPRFPRNAKQSSMPFIHHHRPDVPSTNQWAMDWLKSETPRRPILFTADHQTKGKGQRERQWHSERGRDVVMSLVLPVQPHWTPASLNKRVALTVRSTLLEALPGAMNERSVLVKWPNDVLIWHGAGHYKVGGILVENVWRGSAWSHAVIGIGVNVQSRRLTQHYRAISLSDAWQSSVSPLDLVEQLAKRLIQDLHQPFDSLDDDYHRALFALKETRPFVVEGRTFEGRLTAVDAQGEGQFSWDLSESAASPPPNRLASSEVQWCWPT